MKKNIYTLVIILLSSSIYAQNQISGIITDSRTSDAEGANLYLLEQHKGTVTNIKGEYKLRNLPNGKLPVF